MTQSKQVENRLDLYYDIDRNEDNNIKSKQIS